MSERRTLGRVRAFLPPPLVRTFLPAGLLAQLAWGSVPVRTKTTFEAIKFNDLAAGLRVQLQWSWHAIGSDSEDNVYVVFGGPDGDSADCALFQYSAKTGKRRLIGTLSQAAKDAGTWREGERIEKVHTHLPWLDGRIYIGTMGFHDASAASPQQMEIAAKSHGAHLIVYDPRADRIEDLSANQPDGVFFPRRGFMCLRRCRLGSFVSFSPPAPRRVSPTFRARSELVTSPERISGTTAEASISPIMAAGGPGWRK